MVRIYATAILAQRGHAAGSDFADGSAVRGDQEVDGAR
jgi:hypothetical protein